jgi:hypothetical protein
MMPMVRPVNASTRTSKPSQYSPQVKKDLVWSSGGPEIIGMKRPTRMRRDPRMVRILEIIGDWSLEYYV